MKTDESTINSSCLSATIFDEFFDVDPFSIEVFAKFFEFF